MGPLDSALLKQIPQARRALVTLSTIGVVTGVLTLGQAYVVTQLVVAVVQGRDLSGPALWLLAVFATRGVVAGTRDRVATSSASRVTDEIRRRRIASWLRMPVESRPSQATADTLATESVDAVEPYVARYLPALVTAGVLPPLVILAMLVTDWLSALIVVLTLPLLPVFAVLIGQHTRDAVDRRFAGSVRLAGHFADVVRGLPTLVSYQRAEIQADQVERVGAQHRRSTMGTLRIAFLSSAALELISTLSVAIVAVAVGLRLAGGSLTLEVGLLAILLAPEAYWPIRRVGQEFHAAADGAQALAALLDGNDAAPVPARKTLSINEVRVADLSYTFPDTEREVLSGETFRVTTGLTALTGPSGCGKTTLLELLAGVRTPTCGTISAPDAHLVGQRPFIAPTTVADNLTLGGSGSATVPPRPTDDAEWGCRAGGEAVALARHAHSAPAFDLPLTTELGDEGFGLSAGQRARVALERAAHSGAPLLLLDEPTAHLDPTAASDLIDRLRRLARARVVVVATHDPGVIAATDRVLDLNGSRHGGSLPSRMLDRRRGLDKLDRREDHPRVLDRRRGLDKLDRREDHPRVLDRREDHPRVLDRRRGLDKLDRREDHPRVLDRRRGLDKLDRRRWGLDRLDQRRGEPGHVSPIVRAGLIGATATASGVALTATSGWLIVRASEQPLILTLIVAIVLVRTFGVARPALRYLERLRSHDAALRDLGQRRVTAYRRLVPLTPARLGRHRRADLLTGFVRDLDDVVEAQVRVVVPLVSIVMVGVLATMLTWWVSAPTGWVIGAQVAACLVIATLALRCESRDETATLERRTRIHGAARLATANAADLQAIRATDWALGRLDEATLGRAARARGRSITAVAVPAVTAVAIVLAARELGSAVSAGTISPPVAALLVLTPLALGEVLDQLPDVVSAWARARVAHGRVRRLLDQESAVTGLDTARARALAYSTNEGSQALAYSTGGEGQALTHPTGGVDVSTDGVTAEWIRADRIPLPDITIHAGEHVAVTGPNGCGKSTLLAVLGRHLDPATGTVRCDDRDVRTQPLDDVRRQIALVDDEPHVFAGTVRANLLLAQPSAEDPDLLAALDEAGLSDWFANLPDGLGTLLGQDVRHLSGGERARLGLARALLSGRRLLLLDEPVAHLDHPTARRVLADLHRSATQRTVLLVSHQGLGEDGCDRVLRWGAAPAPTPEPERAHERTAV